MILDKIKHGLTCGITLDNTRLIENEDTYIQELSLMFGFQIVECIDCGNRSLVFRHNNNTYIEKYTKDLEKILTELQNELYTYEKLQEKYPSLIFETNKDTIIEYPLGVDGNKIFIFSARDKNTGEIYDINESLDIFYTK